MSKLIKQQFTKRTIKLFAVVLVGVSLLVVGTSVRSTVAVGATTVEWKGVTWDVLEGSAVVDGNGYLVLTAGSSGNAVVHVNRLPGLETVTTPSVELTYTDTGDSDHKIDMQIADETATNIPYVSFGSLWSAGKVAVLRYTNGGPPA